MTAVDEVQLLPTRKLRPGQRTEVWIADAIGGAPELVYASEELLLEAPNWAPDGAALLLNGDGLLWRLTLEPEVALVQVNIDNLPPINNDHVLDPPRGLIYLSANDGHLYVAPIEGGTATRVSHDSTRYHFLHVRAGHAQPEAANRLSHRRVRRDPRTGHCVAGADSTEDDPACSEEDRAGDGTEG